ncbi:MAG: hypothetical protein ACK5V2_12050, partial [Pseudomonadota bacterium]
MAPGFWSRLLAPATNGDGEAGCPADEFIAAVPVGAAGDAAAGPAAGAAGMVAGVAAARARARARS